MPVLLVYMVETHFVVCSRRSQVISQFEQENGMTVPDGELCSISTSTCFDEEHDEEERANHSTTRVSRMHVYVLFETLVRLGFGFILVAFRFLQTFARGHGASGVSASTCRRSKSLERSLAEDTPTVGTANKTVH